MIVLSHSNGFRGAWPPLHTQIRTARLSALFDAPKMLARALRRAHIAAGPATAPARAATAAAFSTARAAAAAAAGGAPAPKPRVLVTGAIGQIGMELVDLMRTRYGNSSVVASDVRCSSALRELGPFAYLDVTNQEAIAKLVVVRRSLIEFAAAEWAACEGGRGAP